MARSQNGWTANNRLLMKSYNVPGGKITLRRGPAGRLLVDVLKQFNAHVEPLHWPGVWGYAPRNIRGSSQVSNHASGTAADANAPAHPLGTPARQTFTNKQIDTIRHTILPRYHGAIRWGGDYHGRPDSMHFEINANAATVKRVEKTVGKPLSPNKHNSGPNHRKGDVGTGVKGIQRVVGADVDGYYGDETVKAVKHWQEKHGLTPDGIWGPASRAALTGKKHKPAKKHIAPLKSGSTGKRVKKLQRVLNKWYPHRKHLKIDGKYGPATTSAVKHMQKLAGLTVDGVAGSDTLTRLGIA